MRGGIDRTGDWWSKLASIAQDEMRGKKNVLRGWQASEQIANSGGGRYESALSGALGCHVARVLPVCTEWSDALWSLARAWLELEVEQRIFLPSSTLDRELEVVSPGPTSPTHPRRPCHPLVPSSGSRASLLILPSAARLCVQV